jgi:hypothetical protein
MDLFNVTFNALSPYLFSILKLALAVTLFTNAMKIIRSRVGGGMPGAGNPYSGVTTAFIGYLFGRGIPVIIKIIDRICNDIISSMGG